MLARDNRITKNDDFKRVMRKGRRIATDDAIVFVLRTDSDVSRMGVITAKDVGNSVARHSAARRLREVGRIVIGEYADGIDMIIRARVADVDVNRLASVIISRMR